MVASDLDQVMEIEQQSYQFPWTEGIFRDCLAGKYFCTLYSRKELILGYTVSQFVVDECHLLNLCVRPEERNRGIGKKMIDFLLNQARRRGIQSVFLEVRVSNAAAIHLYQQQGFNEVGLRADYYPASSGREDALVLACDIY
jgi:ribosomal-protein-alanine N-acetyltransferase